MRSTPRAARFSSRVKKTRNSKVLDLNTGAIKRRMKGYGVPHSLYMNAAANELLVIDGEKPSPVLDATTLKVKRTYALPKGADSYGLDGSTGHLWIVTGGKDVPQKDSNMLEVDPATGKVLKSVHFDADHVEAMAIEQAGPNIFINVTDKNYMQVHRQGFWKNRQNLANYRS